MPLIKGLIENMVMSGLLPFFFFSFLILCWGGGVLFFHPPGKLQQDFLAGELSLCSSAEGTEGELPFEKKQCLA